MNTYLEKFHSLKRVGTLLLLFIFSLGITPKKTLHQWFANHKDITSGAPVGKTQQLTKAGFNCNCENLVAESHFVTFSSLIVINISSFYTFASYSTPSVIPYLFFQNNLRGPPLKILAA